ncbi:MAG: hypothetical protein LBB38_04630 [Puniceicoccales bacterium]|jgi:hypothetical protein|nr:hypothetical protein [Puniceicoccales bacterium]
MCGLKSDVPFYVLPIGTAPLIGAAAGIVAGTDTGLLKKITANLADILKTSGPNKKALALFILFSIVTGFLGAIVTLIAYAMFYRRKLGAIRKLNSNEQIDQNDKFAIELYSAVVKAKTEKVIPAGTSGPSGKSISFEGTNVTLLENFTRDDLNIFLTELFIEKASPILSGLNIADTAFTKQDGTENSVHRHICLQAKCRGENMLNHCKCNAAQGIDDVLKGLHAASNIAYCGGPGTLTFDGLPPSPGKWNKAIDALSNMQGSLSGINKAQAAAFSSDSKVGRAACIAAIKTFIESAQKIIAAYENN